MQLKEEAINMLDRLDKYIDRRIPDDGPDWEYTKLDEAMRRLRHALEETNDAA